VECKARFEKLGCLRRSAAGRKNVVGISSNNTERNLKIAQREIHPDRQFINLFKGPSLLRDQSGSCGLHGRIPQKKRPQKLSPCRLTAKQPTFQTTRHKVLKRSEGI